MPVHFDNVHFNAFANYAQERLDAGQGKAVINATISHPLGGRKVLTVDKSQTDPGTGKPVTTVVGAGSTVEAHLTLTLDAAEYDHLATLDYTRFDDTQANAVMADKNATQKLPTARQTFAPEFRFVPNALTLRVGLLATIN